MEQGGICSSKLFQLTTDRELVILNATGSGVSVGSDNIAALGQADNEVLLSTDIQSTQAMIDVAVELSSSKL